MEARFLELRGRVLELAATAQGEIAAAEARAKVAEDRLAATMATREAGRVAAWRLTSTSDSAHLRKAGYRHITPPAPIASHRCSGTPVASRLR